MRFTGIPLYPYLLALIYKLFGYGPFLPGFLQSCADAGTAVILYKLAERLFTDSADDEKATEPSYLHAKEDSEAKRSAGLPPSGGHSFSPNRPSPSC